MSHNVYGNMKPVPEITSLDTERGRFHGEGLIVRTAMYFQFFDKGTGEYVTPLYERSTKEFWQGVRMTCLVASLVGRSRNIIQAGYWGVDFPELHFVLMELDGLTGMFLEKEPSWRRGKEDIIWVHTRKYAYALQEPAEPYQDIWNAVLSNWQKGHGGRSGAFKIVDREKPQPSWWSGKQDWEALLAYKESEQGEEEEESQEEEEEEEVEEGGEEEEEGDDDDDDKEDRGKGKGKGRGNSSAKTKAAPRRSARNSTSTRQPVRDQVEPERRSRRTASLGGAKAKARATTPEEAHAEGSGSTKKRASVRRADPSPDKSNARPAKKARVAATPDAEPPASVLIQSRPSIAGPSRAQPSGTGLLGTGSSGAGPSTLVTPRSPAGRTRQAVTEPTLRQESSSREAPHEDARPSKRARIDPPPGNSKGKQKALPTDQPALDPPAPSSPPASTVHAASPREETLPADQPTVEAPTPAPPHDAPAASPHDSAIPSASPHAQASAVSSDVPSQRKISFLEWQSRREVSVLQHENMRGENAQVHGDSTSQGTPSQTPPNSTLEAPVYGPFPPPTSSPITPLTAWTTRPLTQVTPATPPGALKERDSGGNTEEPGEVDMSVSSSSGEGATEQDSVGPPEDVQVGTHMPAGLSQADVQGELSRVRDLLAQVGSREAHFAIPVAASTLSGPSANLATSERLAIDAVRGAAETLQRVTGVPVEPHLPTPGQVRPHSPPGPVDAGTSQASAVAGPSAQQERPQGVEDIGNRMSDLDLATRAPVRAGKQVQGRK